MVLELSFRMKDYDRANHICKRFEFRALRIYCLCHRSRLSFSRGAQEICHPGVYQRLDEVCSPMDEAVLVKKLHLDMHAEPPGRARELRNQQMHNGNQVEKNSLLWRSKLNFKW